MKKPIDKLARGLALAACAAVTPAATAQVVCDPNDPNQLLCDNFAAVGTVDSNVWRLPFDTEGTFVGRTAYRGDPAVDLPLQGISEALAADGSVMEVTLDTFSPLDPGNAFLAHDVLTKRGFARGGGVSIETRMRLKPGAAPGLVNGFFLFDVKNQPGDAIRDEIDWELISNQTGGAATQDPSTNLFNDVGFTGPESAGDLEFHDVAGFDLTQFNDYRVDWTPQSVQWYVNNQLVRTETENVPDDPMQLHYNIWAPDSSFAEAFNSALQPTASAGANVQYAAQVDHVEVRRFDTDVSGNLLANASFEAGAEGTSPTFIGSVPATTTGDWLSFGNVFYELDDFFDEDPTVPDEAPDGIALLKMFGPFSGGPNASGVLQNQPAQPGEEFEASVSAFTPSGDSILGSENFTTVEIRFLDALGNLLEVAPGSFFGVNSANFPLIDGRDPNAQDDLFVEGVANAIAPDGTAFVQVALLFNQTLQEGGAAWFDDASLVRLTPTPTIDGDYNRDGVVNAADYTQWRNNVDGLESSLGGNGTGDGLVNGADYTLWASSFGNTSSAQAVPEPTAVGGLLVALLAIGGRAASRRR